MDIAAKYKYQSDVEHVLSNAGMYLGSIEPIRQGVWIYTQEGQIEYTELNFHPALYKIIDEPLTNCYDHYVRSRGTARPVCAVRVSLSDTQVIIHNDGDSIDVTLHPETGVYVPEMIFGHLRTSTNYGAEDKIVGGKHGLGVKLTAVWSSSFKVEVLDPDRGLFYAQEFKDNLHIEEPIIKTRRAVGGFVQVTFSPDFKRFGLDAFPDYMPALIRKRLHDFALLAPDVKFYFNGALLTKRTFKHYISSCLGGSTKFVIQESAGWRVAVAQSESEFVQVSFVNGIHTLLGGCHVDYIGNMLITAVRDLVKKKKGVTVPLKLLKDQLFLFVACDVINPSFSGQIKESLISKQFAAPFEFSDEVIDKVFRYIASASCTMMNAKEKIKKEKQDTRLLAESNGSKVENLKGIPELTDANWAGARRSKECVLIVCEGESAATGILSGLKSEDRNKYGVYPLRGKLFNPQDKGAEKIANNKVISDLKKIIGLENGKAYTSTDRLRYGKIAFMTDQDLDGHHIKALGLNVFYSLWPSLLHRAEFIGFIPTPIIKVSKGSKLVSFYHEAVYQEWVKTTSSSHLWTTKYYKGLGTSTASEFKQYFNDIQIIHFDSKEQKETDDVFHMAFSKGAADDRKNWLCNYDRNRSMTVSPQNSVAYSDFINNELIHFSKYDCDRSIPSIDGLKISQRKILFAAFKTATKETKVAQFCGRVAELTHYHHGESNLESTIVGMAQDFVGSNNIGLLEPIGQFGSRRQGGEDSASARYIFTQIRDVASLIYRPEDLPVLDHAQVDGHAVEPRHYMPIIPMILINGAMGIGTGFSCTVLPHDLKEVVKYIRDEINSEEEIDHAPLAPYFKGFKGTIENSAAGAYSTCGAFTYDEARASLIITELPVGTWTVPYKKHLETLIEAGVVKKFTDSCTDTDILFNISLSAAIRRDDIIKVFKLKKTHYETNMYLFDFQDKLRKFTSPEDIIQYYIPIRGHFYKLRKAYLIRRLEERILVARNKARYIQAIIEAELNVFQKKDKLTVEMEAAGYDQVEGSYSYLFKMAIETLCEDNAGRLTESYRKLKDELAALEKMSLVEMWTHDLDELTEYLLQ